MSGYGNQSGFTATATASVQSLRFVKLSGLAPYGIELCGAGDPAVGVTNGVINPGVNQIAVSSLNTEAVIPVECDGIITEGDRVYVGTLGRASANAIGNAVGIAANTTTAAGQAVSVIIGPQLQPSGAGAQNIGFNEDFLSYDTGYLFTTTGTAASALVTEQQVLGGVIRLATNGATTSVAAATNQEVYVHNTNVPFQVVAGATIVLDARVRPNRSGTTVGAWAIGLTSTAATAFIQNAGAALAASFDGAVLWVAAGGSVWAGRSANGATQSAPSGTAAFDDNEWVNLRIVITSNAGDTSAVVEYFVGGVSLGTTTVAIANMDAMRVIVGAKSTSSAIELLDVDYLNVWQTR